MILSKLLQKARSLKKALPGQKNISELVKKKVTTKKGWQQTVYVREGEKPKEQPASPPKKSIIEILAEWFRLSNKQELANMIKGEYSGNNIQAKYGIDVKGFSNYLVEYFGQKGTWDGHFIKNPSLGAGATNVYAKIKKGNEIVQRNISLMRFLHEKYGKQGGLDDYAKYRQYPSGTGRGAISTPGADEQTKTAPNVSVAVPDAQTTNNNGKSKIGGGGFGNRPIDKPGQLTRGSAKQIRETCFEILKKDDKDITEVEKEYLKNFEGMGGVAGEEGRGILDQYYTPKTIIDKIWSLANHFIGQNILSGGKKLNVLEPSAGTGRFAFSTSADSVAWDMVEPDANAVRINKLINGNKADVHQGEFQSMFFDKTGRRAIKNYNGKKYDMVLGNPPYRPNQGKWKGFADKGTPEQYHSRMEEYFIDRGLDVLKDGGVLAYVVPSSFLREDEKSKSKKIKDIIAEKGKLIAAYRLPNGTFGTTGVGTDIIIIRKEKGDVNDFINDGYFKNNPENILGVETTKSGRYGKPERYVALKDGQTIEDAIKSININAVDSPPVGGRRLDEETKEKISVAMMGNKNAEKEIHAQKLGAYMDSNRGKSSDELTRLIEAEKTEKEPDTIRIEALQALIAEGERSQGKFKSVPSWQLIQTLEKVKSNLKNNPPDTEKGRAARANIAEMERELSSREDYESIKRQARGLKKRKKEEEKVKELTAEVEVAGKGKKFYSLDEFNMMYNRQFDKVDLDLWRGVQWDGSYKVEGKKPSKEFIPKLSLHKGKYFPDVNYASGNIFQKLIDLEEEKDAVIKELGKAQYDKQKKLLKAVEPEQKSTENIVVSPISSFAQNFKFDDDVSLLDLFWTWCGVRESRWGEPSFEGGATKHDLEGGLSWQDIVNYIERRSRRKGRDEEKAYHDLIVAKRRENAEALFNRFIKGGLLGDYKKEFEDKYNNLYNSNVNPDMSKIPVFIDGLGTTFKNEKLNIKDVQLEGVSFLCNRGSGLVAYEVGVGKTMTGVLSTVQQMQLGRAKRPMIIVPKATYVDWMLTIKDLFPNLKINDWGNLGGYNLNNLPPIKDGTLTLATYQALTNKMTFKDATITELTKDVQDAMLDISPKKGKRGEAETGEAGGTLVGKGAKTKDEQMLYVEDLGIDHITVDEGHNFKNVFTNAKAEVITKEGKQFQASNEYSSVSGSSSARGVKMWLMSQYIQSKNNGRNVFMLTATPFTNSPIEIYNALSNLARAELKELGIYNINQFLSQFAKIKDEWSVTHTGDIKKKGVIKEFHNLAALQKLIKKYIDFKTVDDINERAGKEVIRRPNRRRHLVELAPTPDLLQIIKGETGRMTEPKAALTGAVLKGINIVREATLSPALVTHKLDGEHHPELSGKRYKLVEDSPKLLFTCGTVANIYKKRPDVGHIIYMPRGVERFRDVVDYLVKQGVPRDAIELMKSESGEAGLEARDKITKDFNNPKGKTKVIIGSSTILEGINLNGNTAFLYNTMLGWNASETVQLEGRAWRQGNLQENVHIITPAIHDSADPIMYQKHDEKNRRFSELHRFKGDVMDVADIDYEEVKFELIKDPKKRADFQITLEREKLNSKLLESNILKDEIVNTRNRMEEADESIKTYQKEYDGAEKDLAESLEKLKVVTEEYNKIKKNKSVSESDKYAAERKVFWAQSDVGTERDRRNKYKRELTKLQNMKESLNQKLAATRVKNIDEYIAKLDKDIETVERQIKDVEGKRPIYEAEARKAIEEKKKKVPGVKEQVAVYTDMLLKDIAYTEEAKKRGIGVEAQKPIKKADGKIFRLGNSIIKAKISNSNDRLMHDDDIMVALSGGVVKRYKIIKRGA